MSYIGELAIDAFLLVNFNCIAHQILLGSTPP